MTCWWRWLADRIVPPWALHVERDPVRLSESLMRRFLENGVLP